MFHKTHGPASHGYHADHTNEAPHADPGGAHGGNFAVGGEAAEAEQDAHEHCHGDGDREHVGEGEENDFEHRTERSAVADDHLEQMREVADEEDESKDGAADRRVRKDFHQDVSVRMRTVEVPPVYRGVKRRRRRLLESTLTELRAMAALAIAGLSRMPKAGYKTPAAMGIPSRL